MLCFIGNTFWTFLPSGWPNSITLSLWFRDGCLSSDLEALLLYSLVSCTELHRKDLRLQRNRNRNLLQHPLQQPHPSLLATSPLHHKLSVRVPNNENPKHNYTYFYHTTQSGGLGRPYVWRLFLFVQLLYLGRGPIFSPVRSVICVDERCKVLIVQLDVLTKSSFNKGTESSHSRAFRMSW